jgi:hypothetical protein
MPKTKKPKSEAAKSGGTPESGSRVATVLKWVGGGTAVLSLVFGLRQLTVMVSDIRDRQRQATELIATSRVQQDAMYYRAAWASLEKAAALRANESGIRIAQEDLAMAWLENIRGSQGAAPFTAIVDSLAPVLSRGVVAGEGARKADLLAHLGWADFLRWRDAQGGADPAERYRQALAVIPRTSTRMPCWRTGCFGTETASRKRTGTGRSRWDPGAIAPTSAASKWPHWRT